MIKKILAVLLISALFICSATTVCVYAQQYTDSEYLIEQENDDIFLNDNNATIDEASDSGHSVKTIVICVIAGMAIGFIINFSIASKNKSVRMQRNASVYTRPGSMILTGSADNFLYSNVERRAKPKQNNNNK